jgi:hypothetical protein
VPRLADAFDDHAGTTLTLAVRLLHPHALVLEPDKPCDHLFFVSRGVFSLNTVSDLQDTE